jgi:HPt (histidine-containing phosphotransfer) domain-containing protein
MSASQEFQTEHLDRKRLVELYGNDMDYAADMFRTFLHDMLPIFDEFDELIQESRWAAVQQLAHKLMPTLGMVGLSDLESMMMHIEAASTAEDPLLVQKLWLQFRTDFTTRIPVLQAEYQRYSQKHP